jgi:hypothetical protein
MRRGADSLQKRWDRYSAAFLLPNNLRTLFPPPHPIASAKVAIFVTISPRAPADIVNPN